MINKCYYINLDKREDRLSHIKNEINKSNVLKIISQRFSAVDGSYIHPRSVNETYPNLLSEKAISDILSDEIAQWGLSITQGGLGVILSYIKIFEEARDKNLFILTLEDDVHLHDNFDNLLNNVINELPSNFDLCYLGYGGDDIQKKYFSENLSIPTGIVTCLPSLIISPEGANKLLNILKNIEHQIDTVIYCNFNKLNVYVSNTKLVEIKNQLSTDIQGNNNCIKNYKKQNYIFATLAYGDNSNKNAINLVKDLQYFNQKVLVVTDRPELYSNIENVITIDYPKNNFSYNDKLYPFEYGLNYEECVFFVDSDTRIFYEDYKKTLTNFFRVLESGFHPSFNWGKLTREENNFFIGKDINQRIEGYNEIALKLSEELNIPIDDAYHYQEGVLCLCKDNGKEKVALDTWKKLAEKLDEYEIKNGVKNVGVGEGNLIGLGIAKSGIKIHGHDFCNALGEYLKYNFYGDRIDFFAKTHPNRKTPFVTEGELIKKNKRYIKFRDKNIDLSYSIFIHDNEFLVLKFNWNNDNIVEFLDHEFRINDEIFHFFSDKTNHFFFKRTDKFELYHTYDWYGEKNWELIDKI